MTADIEAAFAARASGAGAGVAAAGGLEAAVGSLVTEMQVQRQRQQRRALEVAWMSAPAVGFTGAQVPLAVPGWGPNTGYAWAVQRIAAGGLGSGAVTTVTGAGTIAAGAGAASLPAGAAVTGFTVTYSVATTAASTITVSNIAGGSLTYDVPSGFSGQYPVSYPSPVPASGGAVTVTVAGAGAAVTGTILVYGQSGSSADTLIVYKGASAAEAQGQNFLWQFTAAAPAWNPGRTGLVLMPEQSLVFGGTLTAASGYVVSADVIQVEVACLADFLD